MTMFTDAVLNDPSFILLPTLRKNHTLLTPQLGSNSHRCRTLRQNLSPLIEVIYWSHAYMYYIYIKHICVYLFFFSLTAVVDILDLPFDNCSTPPPSTSFFALGPWVVQIICLICCHSLSGYGSKNC